MLSFTGRQLLPVGVFRLEMSPPVRWRCTDDDEVSQWRCLYRAQRLVRLMGVNPLLPSELPAAHAAQATDNCGRRSCSKSLEWSATAGSAIGGQRGKEARRSPETGDWESGTGGTSWAHWVGGWTTGLASSGSCPLAPEREPTFVRLILIHFPPSAIPSYSPATPTTSTSLHPVTILSPVDDIHSSTLV